MKARSIVLLSAITGVICLGIGYFVGVISSQVKSARNYQLANIRTDIDDIVALNQSQNGLKQVTLSSVRANLLTVVCGNYRSLDNQQRAEIRAYIDRFNDITSNDSSLPRIDDTASGVEISMEYCKLLRSR